MPNPFPCESNSFCVDSRELFETRQSIAELKQTALIALERMFNRETQLFRITSNRMGCGITRRGRSRRRTIIALLGLHRENACNSPIAIRPVFENLLRDTRWIEDVGDLGLLLWVAALVAPEKLEALVPDANACSNSIFRRGHTIQLSWLLAGLSHACISRPDMSQRLRSLAFDVFGRLIRSQRDGGLFTSYPQNASFSGLIHGAAGSFADQVYAIYALTLFRQAFIHVQALDRALDCALAICEQQGSQGQWWSRYDANKDLVITRFPVRSVHQCGLAPMALLTLGNVIPCDFGPWVYKGIRWMTNNEFGRDMWDSGENLIWSSVERPPLQRCLDFGVWVLSGETRLGSRQNLRIVCEYGSHELGWLLYGLPSDLGQPQRLKSHSPYGDTARPLFRVN